MRPSSGKWWDRMAVLEAQQQSVQQQAHIQEQHQQPTQHRRYPGRQIIPQDQPRIRFRVIRPRTRGNPTTLEVALNSPAVEALWRCASSKCRTIEVSFAAKSIVVYRCAQGAKLTSNGSRARWATRSVFWMQPYLHWVDRYPEGEWLPAQQLGRELWVKAREKERNEVQRGL